MRPRTRQRRGSAYLLVLGTAMLVTIIGLAGIARARVHLHLGAVDTDAVQARIAAPGAVEYALLKLKTTDNWRDSHVNNAWQPEEFVNGIGLSYKIHDDDGDLADDSTDTVRVYGRVHTDTATRIYSVLVQPEKTEGTTNLLRNGDMESGTSSWYGVLDVITSWPTTPHGGAASIRVSTRTTAAGGLSQNLAGELVSGQTYYIEAWVRMRSSVDNIQVGIATTELLAATQYAMTGAKVGTSWTQISGSVTPTWSGLLTDVTFVVNTTTGTQGFDVDDVILSSKPITGPAVETFTLVPGTWRRETDS